MFSDFSYSQAIVAASPTEWLSTDNFFVNIAVFYAPGSHIGEIKLLWAFLFFFLSICNYWIEILIIPKVQSFKQSSTIQTVSMNINILMWPGLGKFPSFLKLD